MKLCRNEHDSTSCHGDWPSCKRAVCTVPFLSLGATRRFLVKARGDGPSTVPIPAGGDLVFVGDRDCFSAESFGPVVTGVRLPRAGL